MIEFYRDKTLVAEKSAYLNNEVPDVPLVVPSPLGRIITSDTCRIRLASSDPANSAPSTPTGAPVPGPYGMPTTPAPGADSELPCPPGTTPGIDCFP